MQPQATFSPKEGHICSVIKVTARKIGNLTWIFISVNLNFNKLLNI